jgi:hypothetical protein
MHTHFSLEYYLVIYLIFNTRILIFKFQAPLVMGTCFGTDVPSSGHFQNVCQQLGSKIIKIN